MSSVRGNSSIQFNLPFLLCFCVYCVQLSLDTRHAMQDARFDVNSIKIRIALRTDLNRCQSHDLRARINDMKLDLLFDDEWFRPISARLLMIGKRLMFESFFRASRSCWCRCLRRRASQTFSRVPAGKEPALIILSQTKSAISSKFVAFMSSITVPLVSMLRSSKSECKDRVATCWKGACV